MSTPRNPRPRPAAALPLAAAGVPLAAAVWLAMRLDDGATRRWGVAGLFVVVAVLAFVGCRPTWRAAPATSWRRSAALVAVFVPSFVAALFALHLA